MIDFLTVYIVAALQYDRPEFGHPVKLPPKSENASQSGNTVRQYILVQVGLAKIHALELLLHLYKPSFYIGNGFYSSYSGFHRQAIEYVAREQKQLTENPSSQSAIYDSFIALEETLEGRVAPGNAVSEQTSVFRRICEDTMLAELGMALGESGIPDIFFRNFKGDDEQNPGWFDAFRLYLAWQINSNENWWYTALFVGLADQAGAGSNAQQTFDQLYEEARAIALRFDHATKSEKSISRADGPPNKVLEYIKENLDKDYEPLAPLVRQQHVAQKIPLDAILSLMAIFNEQEAELQKIRMRLRGKVLDLKKLVGELNTSYRDDPAVSQLKYMAAVAMAVGRFEDASFYLETCDTLILNVGTISAYANARNRAVFDIRLLIGKAYGLQGKYLKTAEYAQNAALSLNADDYDGLYQCLREIAIAMHNQGEEFDDIQALGASIEANRGALSMLPKLTSALSPVEVHHEMAATILSIDKLETSTEMINEAVSSFEQALAVMDEEQAPELRAELLTGLGDALTRLGNRSGDVEILEKAATTHEQSAAAKGREKLPVQWAVSMMHQANALNNIGRRSKDAGTLNKAVAVFELALEEFSQDRQPGQWGWCQSGLGDACLELAKLEPDDQMEILGKVLVVLEKVGEVFTREKHPAPWGNLQLRMGETLKLIGDKTADPATLARAITAFDNGTSELTAQKAPPRWVETQYNIGEAARDIFSATRDMAWHQFAVERLEKALEIAMDKKFHGWIKRINDLLDHLRSSAKGLS